MKNQYNMHDLHPYLLLTYVLWKNVDYSIWVVSITILGNIYFTNTVFKSVLNINVYNANGTMLYQQCAMLFDNITTVIMLIHWIFELVVQKLQHSDNIYNLITLL